MIKMFLREPEAEELNIEQRTILWEVMRFYQI